MEISHMDRVRNSRKSLGTMSQIKPDYKKRVNSFTRGNRPPRPDGRGRKKADMKKKTFDELLQLVKEGKDDPLTQVFCETYQVDGYIVRLNVGFVQWRTPVQTNFDFGLTADEFIKQTESRIG